MGLRAKKAVFSEIGNTPYHTKMAGISAIPLFLRSLYFFSSRGPSEDHLCSSYESRGDLYVMQQ